jgi:hypothetical protein
MAADENVKANRIFWALVALLFVMTFAVIYPLVKQKSAERRSLDAVTEDASGQPFVVMPLALTGAGGPVIYDPEMLASEFEQTSFKTGTYFTGDEIHEFSGPRLKDVITHHLAQQPYGVQASGEPRWWELSVTASAGDEYGIVVPVYDILLRFDPIVAVTMDGKPLPEEYGPLWLVFNRDSRPDLTDEETPYWVWNLERVDIAAVDD